MSKDGTLVASGSVPGNALNTTVVVVDRDAPRGVTTTKTAYTNSSRFNSSFNLPYWATTSTSKIQIPGDWTSRTKGWNNIQRAVVKMFHPAAWGSWAFQVGDLTDGGAMTFSKGGNQEARGNSGTGALYIENLVRCLGREGVRGAGVCMHSQHTSVQPTFESCPALHWCCATHPFR